MTAQDRIETANSPGPGCAISVWMVATLIAAGLYWWGEQLPKSELTYYRRGQIVGKGYGNAFAQTYLQPAALWTFFGGLGLGFFILKAGAGARRKVVPLNSISEDDRLLAQETIDRFNREKLSGRGFCYVARWQGAYLYIDRQDANGSRCFCRMSLTSPSGKWQFARYHDESGSYVDEVSLLGDAKAIETIEDALSSGLDFERGEESQGCGDRPSA